MLGELTDDYDPHPRLFDLANGTLQALASGRAVSQLVLRFEMVALRLLGHAPQLNRCVECGTKPPAATRITFGLVDGGILCPACRQGRRHVVTVSRGAIDVLVAHLAEGDAWQKIADRKTTDGELRAVVNRYLTHLVGHPLKMHGYLGSLVR
jgi:DNA repair protein RecO (recombination protein O)